jgi:putative ABC transport system substrate-binding protein
MAIRTRRREFIMLLGAAATWPLAARAQQPAKMSVIACLVGGSKTAADRYFGGFSQGMRELGYTQGRDYSFEIRYAEGEQERNPLLAEELTRLKPDILVSGTLGGVIAFKRFTDSVPIVSPALIDPVGFGWAASHARPGGNVTGVLSTVEDLPGKQFALAAEMVPGVNRIGVLVNPGNSSHPLLRPGLEVAAKTLGIELITLEARSPDELHVAFQRFARDKTNIVFALADAMFLNERKRIALLAMAERLPTMFAFRENVEDGGLMSYGIDWHASWRRLAGFVDRILKGTKAGDLPIEFPTKLALVINVTVAKILGLTIPPTLLARADEVIE